MSATAKQEAQRMLDNLPEDAILEQIQYHLNVLPQQVRPIVDTATPAGGGLHAH